MPKKLLIGTDVFIDYLMGNQHAREFFEQIPEGTFYYSAITKLELLSEGVCSDQAVRSATTGLLSLGKRMEVDDQLITDAATLRREHELSNENALLSATALRLKAELVTKNIGGFKKINELLLMKPY